MGDRSSDLLQRVEELERRLSQMVVRGVIAAVDPDKALVRVKYGDGLLTGWLTWKPPRTGKAVVWWVPEVGEGATVISDGDLSQGEVLPGSYHDGFPPPSTDPDLFHINFGNGTVIEYQRTDEKLSLAVVGDAAVSVSGNAAVTAEGDATVDAVNIRLNGGKGVVTGAHKCLVLGIPHADCSSTVCAGK